VRRIVSVVAVAWFAQTAGAQLSAPVHLPSVDDWRQDVDQLVADIRLLHPDPFTKRGTLAFLRDVIAFKDSIPMLSDEQRVVHAMRLVASLGDGHTLLEPDNPRYALWYPIRLYSFADGTFITSAHASVKDLVGGMVLEIGGRPASVALNDARSLIGADNPWAATERTWAIANAGLMKGLGYAAADGSLRVKVRLANGREVERTLQPSRTDNPRFKADDATFEWQYRPEVYGLPFGSDDAWTTTYKGLQASAFSVTDTTRPPFFLDRKPYVARSIPAASAYYVRNNYVTDTDFIPFFQSVLADVDRAKPKHLIIDWRFNIGGDGSKLQYLVRELAKRADTRAWTNLYVLTGPKTFSAAVMAVDAVLDVVHATVVGEPTAAGRNHFGDPTSRPLARTGMRLNVSTLRHQLGSSDDLREFIAVDVPAPMTFAEYANGRDPAVDPILRGDDMRSIPLIAEADGGLAARKVYEDRARRFGGLAWYTPPPEFDLRQACDALREHDRIAEAVETCRLNADVHPDVWNTWYNLATVQRAAGQQKERLASYRCVVAIAPNNWNVPNLKRLLAMPGNEGDDTAPGCPVRKLTQ